ncbi:MAG: DnaJ domain [Ilumatobacteraceae bacterium]|nr:DnaJ domain [Ilumatobacteraceae bacterium]
MIARPVPHAVADASRLLGVDTDASVAAVRTAYRQLLVACHPDHNPASMHDVGAARVRQICIARDIVEAHRNGVSTDLLGTLLDRVTAEIATLLARRARDRRPDVRFATQVVAARGSRIDIAA